MKDEGDAQAPPRLVRVQVRGLLGEFDHDIHFQKEWRFCIIHGPNGVGKTKLLKIVSAALNMDHSQLISLPFEAASLHFEDESVFSVAKRKNRRTDDEEPEAVLWFKFKERGEHVSWRYKGKTEIGRNARRYLRQYGETGNARTERHGYSWRDSSPVKRERSSPKFWNQEDISTLVEKVLREAITESVHPDPKEQVPDSVISFFARHPPVSFIDTQRLLAPEVVRSSEGQSSQDRGSAVAQLAGDLSERLQSAMAENARISQRLDRDFPANLLREPKSIERSGIREKDIREKFNKQNLLRQQLSQIGLLDSSPNIPLPGKHLEDWEKFVLFKYLEDVEQKLSSYEVLLRKVSTLRDIINARFISKAMRIEREEGFVFINDRGDRISVDDLSSGEQHELVMFYSMIFKVEAGSLVLIDEPEISLHVTWQQQFLDDMESIAKISDFRFIVATHSPQLVHHWWDRAIALGAGRE